MKKKIIFPLIFLYALTFNIKAQEVKWSKRAGLWGYDYGYGICADDLGNVYVAGKYEMDAVFDEITISIEGNHDIFLAKYGPEGNVIWIRNAGGLYGDYAHAVTCDGEGNTYMTGEIENSVVFNGSEIKLEAWGRNDIFVAKYSPEGMPLWAHRGGGSMSDKGQSIAISKDAVYVTGYFRDTALFNNNGDFRVISAGMKDAFIAKYDLMGNLKWLKRGGGLNDDEGSGITVDADGFVYVVGQINGDVNFDGVSVNSRGGTDAYLAKFDPSGKLLWIKNEGGSGRDNGMAVKAAKDGRIYMTGGFSGKADFGNTRVSSNGSNDIFITCFTSDGEVIWTKSAGGEYSDKGMGISTDEDSNVYITGFYGYSADFNGQTITATDSTEIFIAKYDSNGEFKWVLNSEGRKDDKFEGEHEESGRAIWVDSRKFVLVTGSFRTDVAFGPYAHQGWANTDIFIVKIKQKESDETPYAGIEGDTFERNFQIFPIPTSREINISYTGNETLKINIRLESLEGKILLEKQYTTSGSGNELIMLNGIAKGIYYMQINTGNEHFVKKIIIN
jgi:uncharacterized protein (AIM24 family)